MHEFSVASQAVDKIMETALNRGAKKVWAVEILIGELSLLGEEQFIFWMKEILRFRGEIARDVRINLKNQAAVIKCNHCGYEGNLKAKEEDHLNPEFKCPSCSQEDIRIKKGRDCVLNRIQLEA